MTTRRLLVVATSLLLFAGGYWAVSRGLARLAGRASDIASPRAESPAAPAVVAHITATLFFGSADGQGLVPIQREIPLAEGLVPQGREILAGQLQAPPAPHIGVIPPGTTLRAFYVTERGDAFVDLSREVASRHAGGSSAEILTVYAVVNAVTANLPTIRRVQILIDGKEVDTLAGHVDLRNPLERDLSIVRRP
jgi:hypothetical protein